LLGKKGYVVVVVVVVVVKAKQSKVKGKKLVTERRINS